MTSGERAKTRGTAGTEHSKKRVSGPPSGAMPPTPKCTCTIRVANAFWVFSKSWAGFFSMCPSTLYIDASLPTEDSQSPRGQQQRLWLSPMGQSCECPAPPTCVPITKDPTHSLCLVPFPASRVPPRQPGGGLSCSSSPHPLGLCEGTHHTTPHHPHHTGLTSKLCPGTKLEKSGRLC